MGGAGGGLPAPSDSESSPTRFTPRGVLFVWLYCAVADLAVFNFFLGLSDALTWQGAVATCNNILPFVLLHMSLLANSAVVQIPRMQPYRTLVMMTRWLAILLCVTTITTFVVST